jgi:hypothetical protein
MALSRTQLAAQHQALVNALLVAWSESYPMSEWVSPLDAVEKFRERLSLWKDSQ